MKTGKLFEFVIEELSDALRTAFATEALQDFDGKDEIQCTGCLHTTDRLFAVAETQRHALRAINNRKIGLCGTCIAELIAKENWKIVAAGDRF